MTLATMWRSLLPITLLLAACGSSEDREDRRAERDPAVSGALNDPIMADPDLASQNRGNSVLQGGGPPSAELPPDKVGPEEIERAKAAALAVAGGKLIALPAASPALGTSRLASRVTPVAMAQALPKLTKNCAKSLEYGFIWAARLPAVLPVYPRGHTRQAAGSDAGGCRLRVIGFVTPVPPKDVLSFYATTAGKAAHALVYRREGGDDVLTGTGKALAFAVYTRAFDKQMTEVVLITRER